MTATIRKTRTKRAKRHCKPFIAPYARCLDHSIHKIGALPEIDLDFIYDLIGTRKALTAKVDSVQDFTQSYSYDKLAHLTGTQQGGSAADASAVNNQAKQVTLNYYANGQLQHVKREETGVPTSGMFTRAIDDGDVDFYTEFTSTVTPGGAWQGDQRETAGSGTADKVARWTFDDLGANRRFDVYVTWDNSSPSGRATNAEYTVLDAVQGDILGTEQVNQQNAPAGIEIGGQTWQLLGFYTTTGTGKLVVELWDNADGLVAADAVRLIEHVEVNTNYEYHSTTQQLNLLQHYKNGDAMGTPNAIRSQGLEYQSGSGRLNKITTVLDGNVGSPQVQNFALDDQDQLTGQTGAAAYSYAYDANGNPQGRLDANNRLAEDAANRFYYDDEGNVVEQWAYQSTAVISDTGHLLTGSAAHAFTAGWYRLIVEPFHVDAEVSELTLVVRFNSTDVHTVVVPMESGTGGSDNQEIRYYDFKLESTISGSSVALLVQGISDPENHTGVTSGTFRVDRLSTIRYYTWNHRNQLTGAKVYNQYTLDDAYDELLPNHATPAQPVRALLNTDVTYGYDVLGRRISKTYADPPSPEMSARPNEYYVYDGGGIVLQLEKFVDGMEDALRVTRRFFSGPSGELYAVEEVHYPDDVATSKDVVWALADYQGTVRDLYWQDSSLAHVEHRQFDPYGVPFQLLEDSAGRIVEAMSAGMMLDWETGLHFDGERYLTSASGRYISEAPGGVGFGETNLYAFAGNNPVRERSGATTSNYVQDIGMFDGYSYHFNPINDLRDGNYVWFAGKAVGWTMAVVGSAGAVAVAGPAAVLAWSVSALTSQVAAIGGTTMAAGAVAGGADGALSTYAGNPNAGVGDYALGIGLGAGFGALNPIGAATGLTGGAIGGTVEYARGGDFLGTGYLVGSLAGGLIGGGFDDVGRVTTKYVAGGMTKSAARNAAIWHATRQTVVAGAVVGGAGYAAYEYTGDARTALMVANLAMLPGNIIGRLVVPCFPEGTPILTPDGKKPVENVKEDDGLLARDEFDDGTGPVTVKKVEEIFVREGRIFRLRVSGHAILVTPEHPFYVQAKGWTAAGELLPGDFLSTLEGQWLPVDSVEDTGETKKVYNFRVADYHTYFVAPQDADFGVWVHNAYNPLRGSLGLKTGNPESAAHVVPVGAFSGRSAAVQESIARAKDIMARNGVGIDSWYNGFRAPSLRHFGTHTDAYLGQLGQRLIGAERRLGRAGVLDELNNLKLEAINGAF